MSHRGGGAQRSEQMAAHPDTSDGSLLAAAHDGDGEAFAIFYRRYLAAVVGLLLRETGDREVTADLAAEVFAVAYLDADRYRDVEGGSAKPWLRGIALNKLRESRRRGRVQDRARRRLALEPEVLHDADLERVDALASEPGALALLHELPPRQRDAVQAHVVQERSYAEIAAELRCSEMVVRQNVSRGLSRLRRQLQGGSS
jgi:RNA polymerase sigma factor (sigma-70 family)